MKVNEIFFQNVILYLFIYNLLRFILVLMKWKWINLVFTEFILQYILYKYIVPLKNQN